jgi:V-type H+-transporting ATPase subunit C
MFRTSVEGFKAACKSTRFVVRDFEYSKEAYDALLQRRSSLAAELRRQDDQLNKMSRYAWSDVFAAWVHVKTMRTFVESVLRFGMDSQSNAPNFAAFLVKPASSSSACTKELNGVT